MLIISVGWVSVSMFAQTVEKPADGGHVLLRPLIASDALAFYLYKLFFPLSLGIHYDHSPLTVIRSGWLYFTWIAPVALLVVSIASYKKLPWLLPSAMLFVLGVAPVSGLTPFAFQRFSTVADRYVYLSMLGPALGCWRRFSRDGKREFCRRSAMRTPHESSHKATYKLPVRRTLPIVVIVLALLRRPRSFAQTFTWMDTRKLFTHALKINPRSYDAYEGASRLTAKATSGRRDQICKFGHCHGSKPPRGICDPRRRLGEARRSGHGRIIVGEGPRA